MLIEDLSVISVNIDKLLYFVGILEDLEQERLLREEEEAERKRKVASAKRAKTRKWCLSALALVHFYIC